MNGPTAEGLNQHIVFAKDLNQRLMNQEHLPAYQPQHRMGYADRNGHRQRKFTTTWRSTTQEDNCYLKSSGGDGSICKMPHRPTRCISRIDRGNTRRERGRGQIKKEIDGTKSNGCQHLLCWHTQKQPKRLCTKPKGAIEFKSNSAAPETIISSTVAHHQWHQKGVLDIGYCTRSER